MILTRTVLSTNLPSPRRSRQGAVVAACWQLASNVWVTAESPLASEPLKGLADQVAGELQTGRIWLQSGVAPAKQTKERSVHELFAGAFRNKSSMWIVLVSQGKHQNSQKWAKFMNFSVWPFLWFGLPGRPLIQWFVKTAPKLAECVKMTYCWSLAEVLNHWPSAWILQSGCVRLVWWVWVVPSFGEKKKIAANAGSAGLFLWVLECRFCPIAKKPLTRVSKRVPGVHGKRGSERGWQKRLAEKVGRKGWQKRLAKGWRRVGKGLARGWRRVGKGLADFLAPSNFGIPEAPV